MRDTSSWRQPWANQLQALAQAGQYEPLGMPASRLLDAELVLTCLAEHLPGVDPGQAWAAFNGHAFPALERLSPQARRAIANVRLRLNTPSLGRGAWGQLLAQYRALPDPWPLYRVAGSTLSRAVNTVLSGRLDALRDALAQPPAWQRRRARYAGAGTYRFQIGRDAHEVDIPAGPAAPPAPAVLALRPPGPRPPIVASMAELQEEAGWMDQNAPRGSAADQLWGQRMRAANLRLAGEGGLTETASLTLDGLLHLIGMVGSGKTTLFIVLAVYLARRGHRVTMVQGDVASMLALQEVFDALSAADPQVTAVPLVGRSTRLQHLNRLHIAESLRGAPPLGRPHPGYGMLSTICPLDGLRREVDPIPAGREPCTRLYRVRRPDPLADLDGGPRPAPSSDGLESRYDCPFLPVCPVHLPTRRLADARIWLATPASLIASSPQVPLVPEDVRNVELVMLYSDVLLVDEADRVQVQLDERFAPTEVLVGGTDPWLDRLASAVFRQVYQPGRPLIGQAGLRRFFTAHSNAQIAMDRLIEHIRESGATRRWLSRDNPYFTGARLLHDVAADLQRLGVGPEGLAEYQAAADAFTLQPLEEGLAPSVWVRAVQGELLIAELPAAREELQAWIMGLGVSAQATPQQVEAAVDHLVLALLVVILDHSLQDMIAE
ncbi:MAG TPA: hypothetical protein VKY74_03360, partial [Chloroflexia bacterium]|nr:hypothetical protein [Chloroflexia bacterium]